MRAICNAYEGERPAACAEIPTPKKVDVTVISDKRCGEECGTDDIVGKLTPFLKT